MAGPSGAKPRSDPAGIVRILGRTKSMKMLRKMTVLVLDCQATHSNPANGKLAEIGWAQAKPSFPFDHELTTEKVKTYFVRMDDHFQIPKPFLRITGIKPEELKEAVPEKSIWQNLHRTAKKASSNNNGICPTVIHFSRYEEPYLEQLHRKHDASNKTFPFEIVCTHNIISRLYPGLPRKSLRAAAGYLGFSLPNFRRSLHHVVATAFIWNHVVKILEEKEKITTFAELQDWLIHPPSSKSAKDHSREYPMEKSLRQDLPDSPGIYRMYRSTGDLLYIGKAKSLKHRVNSYFHKKGRHAEHILEMLSQAQGLSTSVTDTALEAAVQESDEIKRLSPPYNRALKPNERQLYFYSRNFKHKKTKPDTQHLIGPIPSSIKLESLAKLIDALNGKIGPFTPQLIEELLDTPAEYAPEKECFQEGYEAFKQEYGSPFEKPIKINRVMQWGTQFWQEKLLERESEKEIETDGELQEEKDQEKREEGWTPERVFKALKRTIRIGSFQIRRARWYCRLSESRLTWSKPNGSEYDKHVLIFEKGKTSPKWGHEKSLLQRQANFDIATYDRMRIVTTEIRRILQEGRDIELSFHRKHTLDKDQLEKILKWV
jgi:DNA polymerase III epsilon subunit-like protein